MAGSDHISETGLDDRTTGRIDLLLYDADYRDAADAVIDAWRVAVLASDPRLRAARERARVEAVRVANARREPDSRPVRSATALHRGCLGLAFLLGVVAVALVATPPDSSIPLQSALLPAGICAAIAVALLWWLEPLRANGSLWGSRAPALIHAIFGSMWLLAAGAVVLFRWDDLDPYRTLPAATGVTLLACAGVAALFLWWHALRADRSGRQTGLGRLTGDLLDPRDEPEVFDALDWWWAVAGPDAVRRDAVRLRTVRAEVLARLRLARIIAPAAERAALLAPPPARWTERRR